MKKMLKLCIFSLVLHMIVLQVRTELILVDRPCLDFTVKQYKMGGEDNTYKAGGRYEYQLDE
ncbi:hypothetical protein [Bacillus sp. es.034]|uniref:hypothetical protein n=1 Tax=Bacillus sp. es.034 TaxID=1761763 RepID=UPI000BFA3777|nr:hypothetical protein [Bacillus sp. es.034]